MAEEKKSVLLLDFWAHPPGDLGCLWDPQVGGNTKAEDKRPGQEGREGSAQALPPTGHPRQQPEGSEHTEGSQGFDVQASSLAAHRGRVALDDVDLFQNCGEDPGGQKGPRRASGERSCCPRASWVPSWLREPVERFKGEKANRIHAPAKFGWLGNTS